MRSTSVTLTGTATQVKNDTGQATFDLEKSGAVVASGVRKAVRGLALETGTYTLNAPAGRGAVVKSLTFTVNGRWDITLP